MAPPKKISKKTDNNNKNNNNGTMSVRYSSVPKVTVNFEYSNLLLFSNSVLKRRPKGPASTLMSAHELTELKENFFKMMLPETTTVKKLRQMLVVEYLALADPNFLAIYYEEEHLDEYLEDFTLHELISYFDISTPEQLTLLLEIKLTPTKKRRFLMEGNAKVNTSAVANTGHTGLVNTGQTGLASAGQTGLASAGQTGLVNTWQTGLASTGQTGLASTGQTGLVNTWQTDLASTGQTGHVNTGHTGLVNTWQTGLASTGQTGHVNTGHTGLVNTWQTGLASTNQTDLVNTWQTGLASTGQTGLVNTWQTGLASTGQMGPKVPPSFMDNFVHKFGGHNKLDNNIGSSGGKNTQAVGGKPPAVKKLKKPFVKRVEETNESGPIIWMDFSSDSDSDD